MAEDIIKSHPGYKARAPRFPIQTPVRYRRAGTADWLEGKSVNISRTGILFRAEEALQTSSMLELNVLFESKMTLSCWGPVVRSEPTEAAGGRPALAVNFLDYRLQREPAAPL